MRKKGKKYILKESKLKSVIKLCLLCETMETTGTTATTVQTGQTDTNAKPAVQTPPQTGQMQAAGTTDSEATMAKAKEELGKLMKGLVSPANQVLQWLMYTAFGGSKLWSDLVRRFGWDTGAADNGDVGIQLATGNGMGQQGGGLKAVTMPYSEWVKGEGQNHVSSQLTNVVALASPNNYSKRTGQVSKVTIHHMAGVGTAEGCGAIFQNPGRKASSNYGIGNDGRIGLYVPEDYRAFTSSSSENDNVAITIEVSNSQTGGEWPISRAALNSLVSLCRDICSRYGITPVYNGTPSGTFTEHRMFPKAKGTACPGPYIHNGLAGQNGQEGWLIRMIKGAGGPPR